MKRNIVMRPYCVVYRVGGIHYRYRCYATSTASARANCKRDMLCSKEAIVEVYKED